MIPVAPVVKPVHRHQPMQIRGNGGTLVHHRAIPLRLIHPQSLLVHAPGSGRVTEIPEGDAGNRVLGNAADRKFSAETATGDIDLAARAWTEAELRRRDDPQHRRELENAPTIRVP